MGIKDNIINLAARVGSQMDIHRNITDYNDILDSVEVGGNDYRTTLALMAKEPRALVGFAFGGDEYNKVTAKTIVDARRYFNDDKIPIYVQAEVGNCLEELGIGDGLHSYGTVYGMREEASSQVSKVNAREVFGYMLPQMNRDSVPAWDLAFFGHPAHIHRVQGIGKKMGLEGGVFLPKEVSWPKDDIQGWVRSEDAWRIREIVTRMHHIGLGWVPKNWFRSEEYMDR